MRSHLKLKDDGPDHSSPGSLRRSRTTRDWKNGEGVEGYLHYPSSSALAHSKQMLVDWVINRETIVLEHLLPI